MIKIILIISLLYSSLSLADSSEEIMEGLQEKIYSEYCFKQEIVKESVLTAIIPSIFSSNVIDDPEKLNKFKEAIASKKLYYKLLQTYYIDMTEEHVYCSVIIQLKIKGEETNQFFHGKYRLILENLKKGLRV